MHQNLKKHLTLCCVGVAALVASADRAQATLVGYPHLEPNDPNQSVLLSDLLGDPNDALPGIIVGDKLFTEFFYSTLPNDDMPSPENIRIFGFRDLDDNLGISFHGAFLDLPGGGPSDALIRFTVEVSPEGLEQGNRISDAHLFLGGVGVGDNSYLIVDESFLGINKTLNGYSTMLGEGLEEKLSDEVYFDDLYYKLRVTKDILAYAGDTSLPARVAVIDQSFSQTEVPEPTTLVVFAMFGLGLASSRRRPPRRDSGS